MNQHNKTSFFGGSKSDFNKLKLGLNWAPDKKKGAQVRFNKLRMLLTNFLRTPSYLRIDNNKRYRIF
jgi:hypothetical protein